MSKISPQLCLIVLVICSVVAHAARVNPGFSAIESQSHEAADQAQAGSGMPLNGEACRGINEEDCLIRRTLAAHVDYIYTQDHSKISDIRRPSGTVNSKFPISMVKDRRESKEKRLTKCVKAPFRFLAGIKNFYVHIMIRFSGQVRAGNSIPPRHLDGLPRTYSLTRQRSSAGLSLDEDLRELVKAASTRRLASIIQLEEDRVLQRKKSDGNKLAFPEPRFMPRSSTITCLETIDEEELCELGEGDVNAEENVRLISRRRQEMCP
ncbi:hypothetical protein MLD38_003317 [Melastoma candidum]|uniref:Uncharacterized protein n=1 Tax=Melastoma candidum TaxID=119954 RepID=A0ACB9S275_9MYRT|nr:hypothetical protein MLD38_003317 [Melastoma candidum]